jgi:terminal uridylyltransferase
MSHQPENLMVQVEFLDRLASYEVPKVEINMAELEEKEAFRIQLERIFKDAVAQGYSGPMATIDLVGFGSLASGFGMPGSDMDLAIVPGWKDASDAQKVEIDRDIPRLLERATLDSKMGGRLLTRTRVPILKVCQRPSEELYQALFDERKKWDELTEEEKYPPPPPPPEPASSTKDRPVINVDGEDFPALGKEPQNKVKVSKAEKNLKIDIGASNAPKSPGPKSSNSKQSSPPASAQSTASQGADSNKDSADKDKPKHHEKTWLREKVLGPLDFPKSGIGIQCDINFENPLGIHNTHLLRCYSLCDPRVRPMVLFVKSWAKRRKINSSYSGTLSSYGWVLMVLHYLVNVAQPPVCPNLQHCYRQPTDIAALEKMFKETMVAGYAVRFWRNESEIIEAARAGQLTRNTQSLGALLRGFFQYFASPNTGFAYGPRPPAFYWTTEVLSLRTPNGILSKQSKGWTGAKTTIQAGKEVRNRYLFAIEDPFEIDHNVARTVTHNGIVAIRDEFRRAWRILQAIGRNAQPEGGIFDDVVEEAQPPTPEKAAEKVVTMETLVIDGVERASGSDQKEKEIGNGEQS